MGIRNLWIASLAASCLVPGLAGAQAPPLLGVLDVSTEPASSSSLFTDQEVFSDDLARLVSKVSVGRNVAAEQAIELVALLEDADRTLFVVDSARRLGVTDPRKGSPGRSISTEQATVQTGTCTSPSTAPVRSRGLIFTTKTSSSTT